MDCNLAIAFADTSQSQQHKSSLTYNFSGQQLNDQAWQEMLQNFLFLSVLQATNSDIFTSTTNGNYSKQGNPKKEL